MALHEDNRAGQSGHIMYAPLYIRTNRHIDYIQSRCIVTEKKGGRGVHLNSSVTAVNVRERAKNINPLFEIC